MTQNRSPESVKANKLFEGADRNIKLNISQKDFLEKKEGDIIYQTGDNAEYVFLILEGEVKLKLIGIFNNPVIVKSGKNEFFGEKELLDSTKRTSSAVANMNTLPVSLTRTITLQIF